MSRVIGKSSDTVLLLKRVSIWLPAFSGRGFTTNSNSFFRGSTPLTLIITLIQVHFLSLSLSLFLSLFHKQTLMHIHRHTTHTNNNKSCIYQFFLHFILFAFNLHLTSQTKTYYCTCIISL